MEYKVIKDSPLSTLVEKVNESIQNGWEPIGGIAGSINGEYSQAMIKK